MLRAACPARLTQVAVERPSNAHSFHDPGSKSDLPTGTIYQASISGNAQPPMSLPGLYGDSGAEYRRHLGRRLIQLRLSDRAAMSTGSSASTSRG